MNEVQNYSVLYKINAVLQIKGTVGKYINISPADIVSILFLHNYDKATFPVIRLRLYTDLTTMEFLTEYPDDIYVNLNMYGNVYNIKNGNDQYSTTTMTPVSGAKNISFALKGYIENKNTPTSVMDDYDKGIKKENDLNVSRKVPIDIYCYDDKLIHFMQTKVPSIYINMSVLSIIETMFRNQGIVNLNIDPLHNTDYFNQVLIPNLNVSETLSFFDSKYGLYKKGASVYGDIDKFYISNTDVDNSTTPLSIHVESYKSNTDMGGLRKYGNSYQMNTKAENVSVLSESDIERILNSETINVVDINTGEATSLEMEKLYSDLFDEKASRVDAVSNIEKYRKTLLDKIETTAVLHKSKNNFIANMINARISERITKIDLSGVGFDIGNFKVNTRYNLIFDSPIRGMSMNQFYRPSKVIHVISNLDSDLFIAQTTMNLCNN